MTPFVRRRGLILLHGQQPEQTRAVLSYCAPLVFEQYSLVYHEYCI